MFKKIINWFTGTKVYQSDIERYIISRNPQTPADVDYLLKNYDYMVAATRWF